MKSVLVIIVAVAGLKMLLTKMYCQGDYTITVLIKFSWILYPFISTSIVIDIQSFVWIPLNVM